MPSNPNSIFGKLAGGTPNNQGFQLYQPPSSIPYGVNVGQGQQYPSASYPPSSYGATPNGTSYGGVPNYLLSTSNYLQYQSSIPGLSPTPASGRYPATQSTPLRQQRPVSPAAYSFAPQSSLPLSMPTPSANGVTLWTSPRGELTDVSGKRGTNIFDDSSQYGSIRKRYVNPSVGLTTATYYGLPANVGIRYDHGGQRLGWVNLNVPSAPLNPMATLPRPSRQPSRRSVPLSNTLTVDINNVFHQQPARQFIGDDPNTGISSATFVDPHTGVLTTYFYGGRSDGNMFGRRLNQNDQRVARALAAQPLLRSGLPARVQQFAATNHGIRHAAYDERTRTYRYAFKNGNEVTFDHNFQPLDTAKFNRHASGADQVDSLTGLDYFSAAAGDGIDNVQNSLRNYSRKAGQAVYNWFASVPDMDVDGVTLPGQSFYTPSSNREGPLYDMTSHVNQKAGLLIGNSIKGAGTVVAGAPDAAQAGLSTAGAGVATDVDGALQLGNTVVGNKNAADAWNRKRLNDLNDTKNQFHNLVLSMAGGADGPTVNAIAGVMAIRENKPELAKQFLADAVTKEGRSIIEDPVQAYLTFEGIGGAWRMADVVAARSTAKLVDRLANGFDAAAAQADKNGQFTTAHAARAKSAALRSANGKLNQLIQAAKARGILADTKETVANPGREKFAQNSTQPQKATRLVHEKPGRPAEAYPPSNGPNGSTTVKPYTSKAPPGVGQSTQSNIGNTGASAPAGAFDIWSGQWGYGGKGDDLSWGYSTGSKTPVTSTTPLAPVSWREGMGIGEDGRISAPAGSVSRGEIANSSSTATPSSKARLDHLDAIAEAAWQRLNKRNSGRLNSGIDPEDLKDIAIWGAAKVAKGSITFADWSRLMLDRWGEQIRPHLNELWWKIQDGQKGPSASVHPFWRQQIDARRTNADLAEQAGNSAAAKRDRQMAARMETARGRRNGPTTMSYGNESHRLYVSHYDQGIDQAFRHQGWKPVYERDGSVSYYTPNTDLPNYNPNAAPPSAAKYTDRPLYIAGSMPYNLKPNIPGYEWHHVDAPLGGERFGYENGTTIALRNDNSGGTVEHGINLHTGRDAIHGMLDRFIETEVRKVQKSPDLSDSDIRRIFKSWSRQRQALIQRRFWAELGLHFPF